MAKPDNNRRAVYQELQKKQKAKERRNALVFTLIAVVVAALILAIPVKSYVDQRHKESRDVADIGLSASAAGCTDVTTKDYKVPEAGNHVAAGTQMNYEDAPPAMGQHWINYLQGAEIKNQYSAADRPPLGRLVHSQEHGYTLVWYDETAAKDSDTMDDLDSIAAKYPDAPNDRVMVVPWLSTDGAAFPDGAHIAFTHWSGKPKDSTNDSKGVWEYCKSVSGKAAQKFIDDYPASDAPEPGAM